MMPRPSLLPLKCTDLAFRLPVGQPSEPSQLRTLLHLELLYSDSHLARIALVHVVAVLGVAAWLAGCWSQYLPSWAPGAVAWLLVAVATVTLTVAAVEWNNFTRLERNLMAIGRGEGGAGLDR